MGWYRAAEMSGNEELGRMGWDWRGFGWSQPRRAALTVCGRENLRWGVLEHRMYLTVIIYFIPSVNKLVWLIILDLKLSPTTTWNSTIRNRTWEIHPPHRRSLSIKILQMHAIHASVLMRIADTKRMWISFFFKVCVSNQLVAPLKKVIFIFLDQPIFKMAQKELLPT